ncbi:DUF58 domain-containing protein [Virgibacillus sp. W0430]|uniref:DUF58 domain-containing protein n=1 Tax=Virgibacillus sp. W0430 TaxID=3391580 RepID=UPI003F448094
MKEKYGAFIRFLCIGFLFIILFAYAMFQGGFVSWFLFFSFLPIGIYLVGLYFYPLAKWGVSRELSRSVVQAGDRIAVTIRIRRNIPFPLAYCVVEDLLPKELRTGLNKRERVQKVETATERQLLFPWFRNNIAHTYYIEAIPRGDHHLKAIRIQVGDLFGLFKKEHIFLEDHVFACYPRKRVVRWERGSKKQEKAAAHSIFAFNQSNIAMSSREYLPGDSLSLVDWKQTARNNKLMTRELEREGKKSTQIMLDATSSKNMNLNAFEAAIEIAFAWTANRKWQNDHVTFTTVGKKITSFQLSKSGSEQTKVVHHLTALQPTERLHSLSLNTTHLQNNQTSELIIITTYLENRFTEQVVRLSKQDYPTVLVYIDFKMNRSDKEKELISTLRSKKIDVFIVTERQWRSKVIEVKARA